MIRNSHESDMDLFGLNPIRTQWFGLGWAPIRLGRYWVDPIATNQSARFAKPDSDQPIRTICQPYQSWLLLKEKQKFIGGVLPQSTAAKKRAKHTLPGDYTSRTTAQLQWTSTNPCTRVKVPAHRCPPGVLLASRLPRVRARRHPQII